MSLTNWNCSGIRELVWENLPEGYILLGVKDFSPFMSYARKPQAFKPGDECHPFEASQVEPGEAE